MAVMITAELPGMTQELYERIAPYILDQVRENAGFIAHAAGPIEGGWQVTEIWTSQSQHDAWFFGSIAPSIPDGVRPANRTIREIDLFLSVGRLSRRARSHAGAPGPGMTGRAARPGCCSSGRSSSPARRLAQARSRGLGTTGRSTRSAYLSDGR
jgi:hypothetical protein